MSRSILLSIVTVALFALGAPLGAQRIVADLEVQPKSKVEVEYGVVRVGRHRLSELEPSSTWRMGKDTASVLRTQVPLLAGDRVVAPGSYRVNVARHDAASFSLGLEGGNFGIDPGAGAPEPLYLPAELTTVTEPADKLEIALKRSKKSTGVVAATMEVRFGEHVLAVPFAALARGKPSKSGPWTLDAYAIPAETLAARLTKEPTPVATLWRANPEDQKEMLAINLLLSETELLAGLAPVAPTASFGFADAPKPDPKHTARAEVAWTDANTPAGSFTLVKFEAKRGEPLLIEFSVGARRGKVSLPDPVAQKR